MYLQIKESYYIALYARSSVFRAYNSIQKKNSENLELNIKLGDSVLGADHINFITEQHYHKSGTS